MRPIIQKQGKSKRGQWTKEQKEYVERCCSFGCIACYIGRGIAGTPASWHHEKERWHGASMRAPHEYGLALCDHDHKVGPESVHRSPASFAILVGMSESELVALSQKMFGWLDLW